MAESSSSSCLWREKQKADDLNINFTADSEDRALFGEILHESDTPQMGWEKKPGPLDVSSPIATIKCLHCTFLQTTICFVQFILTSLQYMWWHDMHMYMTSFSCREVEGVGGSVRLLKSTNRLAHLYDCVIFLTTPREIFRSCLWQQNPVF